MRIEEILLRDPYIMVVNDTYYMYGSRSGAGKGQNTRDLQNGLDVYISKDLLEWSNEKSLFGENGVYEEKSELWAPEVYLYKDRYYMFATLKKYGEGDNARRGTYVFVSDTPDGKFSLYSNGAITPNEWECLDGSLYFENGKPYMVFCHEWEQAIDGKFCVIELDDELKNSVGNAKVLFAASEAKWVTSCANNVYISDGPFLFKEDGILYMLWSSFTAEGYAIGISYSESGSIMGEWKHVEKPLYNNDGGHAMIFNTLKNERKIVFHTPNDSVKSSPKILDFSKKQKGIYSI